jgi:hypothetical protein
LAAAHPLRGVFNQLNLWNTGSMLTACFYDGDSKLKAFFSRIAREWLEGTSLQIDFGESAGLRSCNDAPNADIRITFAQKGSWSFNGTDSLSQQVLQKGASLSIETNGAPFERLAPTGSVAHVALAQASNQPAGISVAFLSSGTPVIQRCIAISRVTVL